MFDAGISVEYRDAEGVLGDAGVETWVSDVCAVLGVFFTVGPVGGHAGGKDFED